ncbi:MAG: pilin protein [Idiomarinaceae bacterium HL-53]|nr:MAG: pilin protein [Idiomarinaceae bacterium HL-53]CUS47180.1 prepilin-type N-terminal cleavage/methylation domain-containing protein [Idiomarinaceae bacterium HL-53]
MENGFSLIELVVVAGILAALATAGVPAFNRWHFKQQYLFDVRQIHRLLTHTQQQARDLATDQTAAITAIPLHSQVSQRDNFMPQGHVQFTANRGMAGFSAGTIRVHHNAFPNHEVKIIVSAVGRIRICETEPLFHGVSPC